MAVFNAADVAPQQASALFNVALAEVLLFAKFAEPVAYYHAGIIPSNRLEDKNPPPRMDIALAFRLRVVIVRTLVNDALNPGGRDATELLRPVKDCLPAF